MKSIYEEFGCKDKEELYLKFVNNDKSITLLKEYMYYYTVYGRKGIEYINEGSDFRKISMEVGEPDEGHIHIFCVDNSAGLRHILYNKDLDDRYEILKSLVTLNFASCFISGRIKDIKQIDSLSNDLDKLRINILDYIYDINYDADIKSNDKAYEYNKDMLFPKEISKEKRYAVFNKYEEFTKTFMERELLNLNFNYNIDKICEILGVGLDRYEREILGFCICDDNKNIISTDFMYAGNREASVLNEREILRKVINHDSNNFFMFHNHPSGKANPSTYDYMSTMSLIKAAELIDIKMLEHLVIGQGDSFFILKNDINNNLTLPSNVKSFFMKEENVLKEKEKNLIITINKDLVKRNEKYNEVRLPKGTVIDGENLEGFKFYPLEIIDTGAKTFKISVKEKENIYLDNGYKFTGKELYDAINNSKKDVNNNFKFRRNQNALQYKMVKKVLGEEI